MPKSSPFPARRCFVCGVPCDGVMCRSCSEKICENPLDLGGLGKPTSAPPDKEKK